MAAIRTGSDVSCRSGGNLSSCGDRAGTSQKSQGLHVAEQVQDELDRRVHFQNVGADVVPGQLKLGAGGRDGAVAHAVASVPLNAV